MNNYRMRRGLKFTGVLLAGGLIAGLIVMLLWNALLPSILGVTTISLIQALGLLILSRILFGGFPGRRGSHGGHSRHRHWREKMKEKWHNMSEEEREAFKERYPWKKFASWKEEGEEQAAKAD
ncbi:MAG: hypothetical protein KDC34_05940 [Saprospiraceae bacterium]|nr:hypothetical protein [Saprospiraceae bacterium]